MFFRTTTECIELAQSLGFDAQSQENQLRRRETAGQQARISFGTMRASHYILAHRVASWIGAPRYYLLWITEFGIWPSSENSHLYYKLRTSYGDKRMLSEAPGHFFLQHESADLVTFIDLVLQFGWGAFLISGPDTAITISHDEWILCDMPSVDQKIISDAKELSLSYDLLS